jgi:hypothetical protein
MIRIVFGVIVAMLLMINQGCGNVNGGMDEASAVDAVSEVVELSDGSILLNLKDAYLFNDENNPDRNTAEWNFSIKSVGRYEVWLSSLTRDTMNLQYKNPVIVNFGDKRLQGQPVGNEIKPDPQDQPFFRADSKLGSIYVEDPGHYNLQVISEKVLPLVGLRESGFNGVSTILDHVILKPLTN